MHDDDDRSVTLESPTIEINGKVVKSFLASFSYQEKGIFKKLEEGKKPHCKKCGAVIELSIIEDKEHGPQLILDAVIGD